MEFSSRFFYGRRKSLQKRQLFGISEQLRLMVNVNAQKKESHTFLRGVLVFVFFQEKDEGVGEEKTLVLAFPT